MRSITAETAFEPRIAKEARKMFRSKPILRYENYDMYKFTMDRWPL
jgi:hypothetical protein